MITIPLAVSVYEISLAIHVVAVVIFLGVSFLFGPLQMAAEKAPQHMPFVIGVIHDAERKMVWPGLVIILVTGVFQTADQKWDQAPGNVWLLASVAIFIFMLIVSFTVMRHAMDVALEESRRAEQLAGPDGEIKLSSDFKDAAAVMSKTGPLLGLGVIVITFLMEAKPF